MRPEAFIFACPVLGLGVPVAIWILIATRPAPGLGVAPTEVIGKSKAAMRAALAFWLASLLTPLVPVIATPLWGIDAVQVAIGVVAMHGAAAAIYAAPAFGLAVRVLLARSIGGGVPGIVPSGLAGFIHVVGFVACLWLRVEETGVGVSAGAWFLVAPPLLALFAVWLRYPLSRRMLRAASAGAATGAGRASPADPPSTAAEVGSSPGNQTHPSNTP